MHWWLYKWLFYLLLTDYWTDFQVHFRIGGAIGTNIDPTNCPRGDGANATATACTGTTCTNPNQPSRLTS